VTVTDAMLEQLEVDPSALSRAAAEVVDVHAQRREEVDRSYVLVVVTAKAPRPGLETWPVGDVRAIRRALQERASIAGLDERLVVTFATADGTGDASAVPQDSEPPLRPA
jgi:hypothetical protein